MAGASSFGSLKALLVEPSAMQAKIICKACEALGLTEVKLVDSMQAALLAMREELPDLVLSALYLPDGSGTELVSAMRDNPRLENLAFILVSSETRPQTLEPVRQSGVCSILPKPFSPAQLVLAINATLDYLAPGGDTDSHFDLEALRVLMVDDSPNARKFMRRVLENVGIRHIVEASNGREGVAVLEESLIDLIVTDYNMPEMDGQAFVEYVRKESWQRTVPILMVTSETNQARLAAVEDAGVSGICDKPFEPAVVRQLLERILGQSRP